MGEQAHSRLVVEGSHLCEGQSITFIFGIVCIFGICFVSWGASPAPAIGEEVLAGRGLLLAHVGQLKLLLDGFVRRLFLRPRVHRREEAVDLEERAQLLLYPVDDDSVAADDVASGTLRGLRSQEVTSDSQFCQSARKKKLFSNFNWAHYNEIKFFDKILHQEKLLREKRATPPHDLPPMSKDKKTDQGQRTLDNKHWLFK